MPRALRALSPRAEESDAELGALHEVDDQIRRRQDAGEPDQPEFGALVVHALADTNDMPRQKRFCR